MRQLLYWVLTKNHFKRPFKYHLTPSEERMERKAVTMVFYEKGRVGYKRYSYAVNLSL